MIQKHHELILTLFDKFKKILDILERNFQLKRLIKIPKYQLIYT